MNGTHDSLSLLLAALLAAGCGSTVNDAAASGSGTGGGDGAHTSTGTRGDGGSHGDGGGDAGCSSTLCATSCSSCAACGGPPACESDVCMPHHTAPCVGDPDPVQGPGCMGGQTTCDDQHQLGSCTGEVTPRPNDCDAPTASSCTAAPLACFVARSAKTFGGTAFANVDGVALDDSGGVELVGSFEQGTIDLGSGPLTTDTRSLFAARFDAAGALVWALTLANLDPTSARPVRAAFAPDGSIGLVGRVTVATNIDASSSLEAGGFVFVLGPDGAVSWSRSLGDAGDGVDPAALAFLASGEVVVVGSATAGAEAFVAPSTTPAWIGGGDVAVLRYDDRGDVESMIALGTDADDMAVDVLPEPDGSITVAAVASPQGMDVCAAATVLLDRIDADGATVWQQALTPFDAADLEGGLPGVPAIALARDAEGDVVASISLSGYVDVGASPFGTQGLLVSFDPLGAERWRRGLHRALFGRVAFDAQDHLVASGWYWDPQDFGVGALPPSSSSIGDALLLKLDDDGHALTSLGLPSNDSNQAAMPFAIAPDDGLLLGGSISGDFTVGAVTVHRPSGSQEALYTLATSP